jgi:alpha-glucosidase
MRYILFQMNSRLSPLMLLFLLWSTILPAQKNEVFEIKSLDGSITLHVETGSKLQWSAQHKGQHIISPSAISMQLQGGEVLGDNVKIISSKKETINAIITPLNYKKTYIPDLYNQLTLNCKNDYGIVFRVYNDGIAYRFKTKKKGEIIVINEEANFNFTDDYKAFIPFTGESKENASYITPFESLYKELNLSQYRPDSLAFLPLMVDVGNNKKVVILEADLEDYPGMFIDINQSRKGFIGVFAPYPLDEKLGVYGYTNLKRADYIASTSGTRNFPWRAIVISQTDKELLNNDMVQKLASPSRISDDSWIKAGQVAWDWWNGWNISHVDFRAGINTQTYKYYIDFAANNKIPYVIMDAGWSDLMDLTKISNDINLQEITDYGNQNGVGVILWASWASVRQQMDIVFPFYSKMGIKGFKVDYINCDDQKAVFSTYEIAKKAAVCNLLIDYHGIFKPTGLQRTYPNVVGYEGVRGMEYVKWTPSDDVPRYDVSIPFIRMIAGPMDYTAGAMRNASKTNFRSVHSAPMSQGTRCHQLAMYVVFEAPLQMLSDNPTIYMKEQECTDFITRVPTTFDETVAMDGKVGEYAAIARRKGDTWFVGAMNNWDARELTLDFSFLGDGVFEAEVFMDGINADREATDYRKELVKISSIDKLKINLSTGGGWAARIQKLK